jgi:hypothetical protein
MTYQIGNITRGFLFMILVWINFSLVQAQSRSGNTDQKIPLNQYLDEAGTQKGMKFYFRDEWVDTVLVAPFNSGQPLEQVFNLILDSGLDTIAYSDWQYILIWKKENPVYHEYDERGNFFREITLSGKVSLLNTEEELIGARVEIDELDTGTITDSRGEFSLKIPAGFYHIRANSVGQEEEIFRMMLTKDTILNFKLSDRVITLNEIIISEQSPDRNVSEVTTGKTQLDILTIRSLPAFMGEVDVIRSLLLMPGVSSVGEGATGFNVRGGTVDQNLVLIDQTPVFNSSHLFGLFSVFNQDIVQDVTLYKGSIPARFGGRLSSVLDVRTRENQSEKFSGKGGVGLISSRLTFDIPLIKDKLSITVGVR